MKFGSIIDTPFLEEILTVYIYILSHRVAYYNLGDQKRVEHWRNGRQLGIRTSCVVVNICRLHCHLAHLISLAHICPSVQTSVNSLEQELQLCLANRASAFYPAIRKPQSLTVAPCAKSDINLLAIPWLAHAQMQQLIHKLI